MVSLLTVGEIETAALRQPKIPDTFYIYYHDIKGVPRYFSQGQERVYRVAKPLMIASFGVTLLMFCVYGKLEERWDERRCRAALEELVRRTDQHKVEAE